MKDVDRSRLELAMRLRELADNSSEAQLRTSLSRSYYSIYHLTKVLFGNVDHHNISVELGKIDPELSDAVDKLKKLRSQADYMPDLVDREFGGDVEQFRLEVRKQVDQGLFVFRRVLRELDLREQIGGGR